MAENTQTTITSWADESFNSEEDDSIHEKLNTILSNIANINTRMEAIEKFIFTKPVTNPKLKQESKVLSDIVKSMSNVTKHIEKDNVSSNTEEESGAGGGGGAAAGGGGGGAITTIVTINFSDLLSLLNISCFTSSYGLQLDNESDSRIFISYIDTITDYIKSKFVIREDKRRIINYNLELFYGKSTYKGIMSTFQINNEEDLCISQIKSQTIPDESEEDFYIRWASMILFQQTFKIYNKKCSNNILHLFEKMFDFSFLELSYNGEDKTNTSVKLTSIFKTYLANIWSYLEMEKECIFHKNGSCKFRHSHGVYCHN